MANAREPAGTDVGKVVAIGALLVLGALTAFAAMLALWTERQLLDTTRWSESSSRLLDDPSIRRVISHEVTVRMRRQIAPLSAGHPQIASAVAGLSESDIDVFLRGAQAHALWRQANRQAHAQLVSELENDPHRNGVVLDLEPLLWSAAGSLGLGALVSAGQFQGSEIVLARPGELASARRAVGVLRRAGAWLAAAAAMFYLLALALARGRRAAVLAACGLSLLAAGGGLVLLRLAAGDAVVDTYVQNASYRSAVRSAWWIETRPLAGMALVLALAGVGLLVAGVAAAGLARARRSGRAAS
ncbi:MAG: hypothetical protein ACYDHO_02800 [Gaiellaceae bacterium]